MSLLERRKMGWVPIYDLDGCLGRALFFWAAVYSGRFLPAEPLCTFQFSIMISSSNFRKNTLVWFIDLMIYSNKKERRLLILKLLV